MGLYTVLRPCVVDNLHYAQVPPAPIEADDAVAGPLVKAGDLAPVESTAAATEDANPAKSSRRKG
jgi:hypothetical protein